MRFLPDMCTRTREGAIATIAIATIAIATIAIATIAIATIAIATIADLTIFFMKRQGARLTR